MTDATLYPVPAHYPRENSLTKSGLQVQHDLLKTDPDAHWQNVGNLLDWTLPFTQTKDVSFNRDDFRIRWFADGQLNVTVNCIDRHLPQRANQVAFIFEGDDPSVSYNVTYAQLSREVNKRANLLKKYGVKKGDRVTIYLPMVPEAAYFMLACARIGAVHSVVFGGFSPDSLAGRILDCKSEYLITTCEGVRGGKKIPLKMNADLALLQCPDVKTVFVTSKDRKFLTHGGRDISIYDEVEAMSDVCEPEAMNAEDPLFILYTSGSTGKPKGVLHTTGGYLAWATYTFKTVFDYHEGDIYWCTADVGWVTGHSYVVYGPLASGATSLIFEGVPNYPTVSRFWEVIDKHQVTTFYTAPTAIRALMREGEEPVTKTSRASLRLLGSVGEPINPEAWNWYHRVVGNSKCPIVDTWWQTETGGHLITPVPAAVDLKPGSASLPLPGVKAVLVDAEGKELEGAVEGNLCIADSWPGQMRSIYGDHPRFIETYFSTYPGKYFTGDGARRDEDGYFWITGRVDDVLNVSGHRLGTAEVESSLVAHPDVAEAAVVGYPHDIKGQGIYCFVTLVKGVQGTEELKKALRDHVRRDIGPIASPDVLQWAPGLPKTRSGKIMRRILRKIAEGQPEALGDISTLADPSVVADLVEGAGLKTVA